MHEAESEVPTVLISTDIATGLVDTHGAQGLCPVTYSTSKLATMHDADFTPQDIDDGLTVALALNLEMQGDVLVDAVIPTFGNATLPAEMLVARQIVWNLKRRTDLLLFPGAMTQAGQVLHPAPQWFDGSTLHVVESFSAACGNPGVEHLRERLEAADSWRTLLAIGPLTDVACLLLNHPEVAPKIKEVIVLASRVEGESLTVNGLLVNDFNFRMDPLAGAIFLDASREIPVRLMTFALSGQTSQEGDRLVYFDSSTLRGPTPPTPQSEKAWPGCSTPPTCATPSGQASSARPKVPSTSTRWWRRSSPNSSTAGQPSPTSSSVPIPHGALSFRRIRLASRRNSPTITNQIRASITARPTAPRCRPSRPS